MIRTSDVDIDINWCRNHAAWGSSSRDGGVDVGDMVLARVLHVSANARLRAGGVRDALGGVILRREELLLED